MDRVLIVGCGDIGRRVARLWAARGVPVAGLARSPQTAAPPSRDSARPTARRSAGLGADDGSTLRGTPRGRRLDAPRNSVERSASSFARLSRLGIVPVPGDLDDGATLRGLPTRRALVYHFAPPPAYGDTDPRTRALVEAVPEGDEPEKVVYVSTTGVYGDLKGGWATEETPAVPGTDRGRRRLDAEEVLRAWGRKRNVPVVVLRVAGIYGPGRLPVEAIRRGTPVLDETVSPYTNRIHAEDLARVCVAAAERGRGGRIYNVSDGVSGTITEYYYAVADRLGLPRPPAVGLGEARKVLSPALLSYLSESRRVDNRRMREELGVALLYPTLAAGLDASLEDNG